MDQSDFIKTVTISKLGSELKKLSYFAESGLYGTFGAESGFEQTSQFRFDADRKALFGLFGSSSSTIASIGFLEIDKSCLENAKSVLGSDFSWDKDLNEASKQEEDKTEEPVT